MTNWKPIETAPKTGEHILLYCKKANVKITGGYWFQERKAWVWDGYMIRSPTHWAKLPQEPNEQGFKGGLKKFFRLQG